MKVNEDTLTECRSYPVRLSAQAGIQLLSGIKTDRIPAFWSLTNLYESINRDWAGCSLFAGLL